MGKNAPFGRPGALDRLRVWWHAKDRSFRVNSLVALAVGAVALGLFAAGLARDPSPSTGLVNATRPHLTTGSLPNPPMTVDIRAAGGVATPLAPPEESTSTSSTVATVPALPTAASSPPRAPATTAVPVAAAAPPPQNHADVPVAPAVPDASPPPLPSTTRPPTTAAVATTVPTSTTPTSTGPTTTVTLLPPLGLPPLLPLPL